MLRQAYTGHGDQPQNTHTEAGRVCSNAGLTPSCDLFALIMCFILIIFQQNPHMKQSSISSNTTYSRLVLHDIWEFQTDRSDLNGLTPEAFEEK